MATGSPESISHTNYGMAGGKIEALNAYLEPRDIWDDLFTGFMTPDMPKDDPNRLLMNAVHADYTRLSNHQAPGHGRQDAPRSAHVVSRRHRARAGDADHRGVHPTGATGQPRNRLPVGHGSQHRCVQANGAAARRHLGRCHPL